MDNKTIHELFWKIVENTRKELKELLKIDNLSKREYIVIFINHILFEINKVHQQLFEKYNINYYDLLSLIEKYYQEDTQT